MCNKIAAIRSCETAIATINTIIRRESHWQSRVSEKRPPLNVRSPRISLSQWRTRATPGANRRKSGHNSAVTFSPVYIRDLLAEQRWILTADRLVKSRLLRNRANKQHDCSGFARLRRNRIACVSRANRRLGRWTAHLVEATIKSYLTEIRNRLDKAAGIVRAADACAGAGFHEKGLEVAT